MGVITIGPLAMPVTVLLLGAGSGAALVVAARRSGVHRPRVDTALQYMLLAGVAAARVSFVLAYWDSYRVSPLSVFDMRDGGFHPWAGLAAGAAVAVGVAARERALLRPLLSSVATGAAIAALAGSLVWLTRDSPSPAGLPSGTFARLDGTPFNFEAFAGQPVVVNLWASWCPPCRREMPVLAQAQAGNPHVVFVFANQGETSEAARAYLRSERIDIRNVIVDTGMDVGRQLRSPGLPTTVFFARDGGVVAVRTGELSAASLEQHLAPLKQRP